jgi:hypothetical protein
MGMNLFSDESNPTIQTADLDWANLVSSAKKSLGTRLGTLIKRDPDFANGIGGDNPVVRGLRDPAVRKQIFAAVADGAERMGITLGTEPGDVLQFIQAHEGKLKTMLSAHKGEVESTINRCKQEMLAHPGLARASKLSTWWIGKKGMGQLAFPIAVYDYGAGTVAWQLGAVPGVNAILDARLVFADPQQIVKQIVGVRFAGNNQWVQQSVDGATTLDFVASAGRFNEYHPNYSIGDGFRLGRVPLGNNVGVKITASLWPGVIAPSTAECYIVGRYDGGPQGVGGQGFGDGCDCEVE